MSWEGKVATLADRYLKGAENLTVRGTYVLANLEQQGRITTNCDGVYAHMSVQKDLPPVTGVGETAVLDFSRHNLWAKPKHGWRGLVTHDMMPLLEKMQYSGDIAMVNRYAEIMDNLGAALRDYFKTGLYTDGSASGNEKVPEGLNTFLEFSDGNTAATDIVGYPNDTYMEISTVPGAEGEWDANLATPPNATLATDWPEGQGTPPYDYWSPKLGNSSSTNWGTESTTWSNNCEEILRRMAQWLALLAGTDGRSLACIMAGKMFTDFKSKMGARNRQLPPHSPSVDLGFPDTLNFEGLALRADFGVAADTAFIWNMEKAELCSLAPELFFRMGPVQSIENMGAWLFLSGFYGNMRVKSPKYFGKIYPYS